MGMIIWDMREFQEPLKDPPERTFPHAKSWSGRLGLAIHSTVERALIDSLRVEMLGPAD